MAAFQKLITDEIDLNSNFLSLISQTKNQINIEIILDNNLENHKYLHDTSGKVRKSLS